MTYRNLIAGTALATLALAATGALAADLPTRKAPPAPMYTAPSVYNWTGFYLGVNAGGVFGTGGTSVTGSPGFTALGPAVVPGSLGTGGAGFIGGGQVGYNYQIGQFVTGLEADIDGTSEGRSASFTGAVSPLGATLTTSARSRLDYLGTVRARVGMTLTPDNRLLAYITGGLAYGGVNASGSVVANGTPYAWSGSNDQTRVGYAVGGGLEYAITNNISLRGEYLYYDLGHSSVSAYGNTAVASNAALNGVYLQTRTHDDGSIVRAGLNFKF